MKKTILLIFSLLLLVPAFLFAGKDGFQFKGGTGNDSFSRGLSRNDDDFKTYGLYLDFEFGDYDIYADLDAYTFKQDNYRYDLLTVGVIKSFSFNDFYVLNAGMGLQIKGNLGGEFMQNSLHRLMHITEVHLPYDPSDYCFALNASVEGYLDSKISPYVYAKTGYDWVVEAGGRLKASNESTVFLTYSYDGFENHGLNLRMDSDFGFFSASYKINLLNHFGYGVYSINPFEKIHGSKSAVTGSTYITNHGLYSMYEIRLPFDENKTGFVNVMYDTGELDHDASIRKEDVWYTAGAGYSLHESVEIRAFGGVHWFETRENYTDIEDSTDPVFGLGTRFRAFDLFNISFGVDAGILWEDGFEGFGGLSLTI